MSLDLPWPQYLTEDQLNIAANFSNPFTCFKHSLLSDSATELFLSSPVLFWLLASHSSDHNWSEKKFISSVALKRTEILAIVCGSPDKLPRAALRFLSRFDGCKLQTDKARQTLVSWMGTGKYEQVRHYKKLFPGLLELFDEFPMLVGARWTHSISPAEVAMQELGIVVRDLLKMADTLGISQVLNRDLPNFSSVTDIQRHHDEVLQLYLEQTGVEGNLLFPDPPMIGTRAIIPVRNSHSLFQEGIDQDNCVYSYLAEILAGQYFVYQVRGIERATLGVRIGANGDIQLDQLLAASNTRVSSQTFDIVLCWLQSIRQEPQLYMAEHKEKRIDDCMSAYMEYRASRGF